MSIQTRILLDRATVHDGDALSLSDALDLGEYSSLGVVLTVHEAGAGSAPTLSVEHAVVNEDEGYVPFDTPMQISLETPATAAFQAHPFLRWIRRTCSGTLSSPAVVTLAIIAKA